MGIAVAQCLCAADKLRQIEREEEKIIQPRSQGLSSLSPLVVGRKTLVAAGHVTTQNLGGKNICWIEGWQSILFVDVTNFVGFKS